MITQRLQESLGSNCFLARYSEEQYAIIIIGLGNITAYEKYTRSIISFFKEAFIVENYDLFVTVNGGISVFQMDGRDSEVMINHAIKSLAQAKELGRNTYQLHTQEMDIHKYKDFELRNDLRKAIEKEQIRIYYQPIVDLQTNEILVVEALIRWEHPTWGLVQPKEFLKAAEETGYIKELGKWMLRETCKNYKLWMEEVPSQVKVSLNYSWTQFFENNFTEKIEATLNEFKLNPDFLIIEIMESTLLNKIEQVAVNIKKLKALGIFIALDNFGTGFSSMEYLSIMNVDIIKVDRTFIKNIPQDEVSTVITKTIINLARELRINVIAEGIENWDQLLLLRKYNCNVGQGYLFSKPVSAEEIFKLLKKKFCKPVIVNSAEVLQFEERRKYYRIQFSFLLEALMSVLEIQGKKVGISNTNILMKNIGPGGLCFVSNIRFPIRRDIILQFTANLLGKEFKVFGCPVWSGDVDGNLYEYGVEFTFDENERMKLTQLLNQVQIKMKNNRGFNEGSFVTMPLTRYFNVSLKNILDM